MFTKSSLMCTLYMDPWPNMDFTPTNSVNWINKIIEFLQVGSTIWMKHFVSLMSKERQIYYKKKSSKKYYNLHKYILKHFALDISGSIDINDYFHSKRYFVFSFVRHPFDRLVSAYIDKIEGLTINSKAYHVFVDV